MRAPAPTFRADLALYRSNLVYLQTQAAALMHSQVPILQAHAATMQVPAQVIAKETTRAAAHSALAIAIIDRWMQDDDADRIWIELAAKLPAGYPARMIAGRLIQYRLQADRLSQGDKRSPEIHKQMLHRAKRYLKENTPEANAKLINEATARMNTTELRARVPLRRGKTAPRTWFMAEWSECFRELCGKPLDNVVCFLTKIAFDDHNVTPDMVRNARREIA
jgi:hypothetical protein